VSQKCVEELASDDESTDDHHSDTNASTGVKPIPTPQRATPTASPPSKPLSTATDPSVDVRHDCTFIITIYRGLPVLQTRQILPTFYSTIRGNRKLDFDTLARSLHLSSKLVVELSLTATPALSQCCKNCVNL